MVRKRNSSAHKREIGEALRNARERANLKAAQLAGRLDCTASKVSRMESGHRGVAELDLTMFLANCGTPRKEAVELLEVLREADDGYRPRPHQERLPDELRSLIAQVRRHRGALKDPFRASNATNSPLAIRDGATRMP